MASEHVPKMSNAPSEDADTKRTVSNEETVVGKDGATTKDHGLPSIADLAQANIRGLRAPEIIARLTPEQRLELEKRLIKKIDLRLLPMIILMCSSARPYGSIFFGELSAQVADMNTCPF